MKSFNETEIPEDLKEVLPEGQLRCPLFVPEKNGPCNRLLLEGEASKKPQRLYCRSCKKRVTFRRL